MNDEGNGSPQEGDNSNPDRGQAELVLGSSPSGREIPDEHALIELARDGATPLPVSLDTVKQVADLRDAILGSFTHFSSKAALKIAQKAVIEHVPWEEVFNKIRGMIESRSATAPSELPPAALSSDEAAVPVPLPGADEALSEFDRTASTRESRRPPEAFYQAKGIAAGPLVESDSRPYSTPDNPFGPATTEGPPATFGAPEPQPAQPAPTAPTATPPPIPADAPPAREGKKRRGKKGKKKSYRIVTLADIAEHAKASDEAVTTVRPAPVARGLPSAEPPKAKPAFASDEPDRRKLVKDTLSGYALSAVPFVPDIVPPPASSGGCIPDTQGQPPPASPRQPEEAAPTAALATADTTPLPDGATAGDTGGVVHAPEHLMGLADTQALDVSPPAPPPAEPAITPIAVLEVPASPPAPATDEVFLSQFPSKDQEGDKPVPVDEDNWFSDADPGDLHVESQLPPEGIHPRRRNGRSHGKLWIVLAASVVAVVLVIGILLGVYDTSRQEQMITNCTAKLVDDETSAAEAKQICEEVVHNDLPRKR